MIDSIIYFLVKSVGFVVRKIPYGVALNMGWAIGRIVYWLDRKHRVLVMSNLTIAFGSTKTYAQRIRLTKEVFGYLGQSFVDVLSLPRMTKDFLLKNITSEGLEHMHEALKQGKGCILLTMHSGSWEVANRFGSTFGTPYRVFVKPQPSFKRCAQLFNEYRKIEGIQPIEKGVGIRDLVRAVHNNEAITLVADQGGKLGLRMPFFNRSASLSVGAVKLAIKMDVPVCFAYFHRVKGPQQHLKFHAPFHFEKTGNADKDVEAGMQKVGQMMEEYLRKKPGEYLWTYKVWKYSQDRSVLILNDGRTGHLRQSQAVGEELRQLIESQDLSVLSQTAEVVYRHSWAKLTLPLMTHLFKIIPVVGPLTLLKWCLTSESFETILSVKPDYVISCGSSGSCPNYLLSKFFSSKKIALQKPGWLSTKAFDLVILPRHDLKESKSYPGRVITTDGAPNIVCEEYLKCNKKAFLTRFSHLNKGDNLKVGLFIGGDSRQYVLTERKMRVVIYQLKELCEEAQVDLLVTTSRRTSQKVENLLTRELKRYPRCRMLIIANRQNIPEAVGGIMGMCDVLCVSGDSISMVSEAASSGKKTVVFPVQNRVPLARGKQKHAQFIHYLSEQSFILSTDVNNLKEAVYSLIKKKLQTRQLNDRPKMLKGLKDIL